MSVVVAFLEKVFLAKKKSQIKFSCFIEAAFYACSLMSCFYR